MSRITELYQSKQTAAPGRGFFFFLLRCQRAWAERQVDTMCSSPGFKGSPGRGTSEAGWRRGERDWRAGREGENSAEASKMLRVTTSASGTVFKCRPHCSCIFKSI